MKDYLAILNDIPAQHSGPLFEQIQLASMAATGFLRTYGLSLPGQAKSANYWAVRTHLKQMVNRALDGFFAAKAAAPAGVEDIWGEDEDSLFSVVVHSLGDENGFTAEIDMNLLYGADSDAA